MEKSDRVERMAELVALRAQRKLGKKAGLRLVSAENLRRELPSAPPRGDAPARVMDDVTRESRIRLIRSLSSAYRAFGFRLIIDQALVGKASIEALSDQEIIALHRALDRARECLRDGIDFEEAGLLRSIG